MSSYEKFKQLYLKYNYLDNPLTPSVLISSHLSTLVLVSPSAWTISPPYYIIKISTQMSAVQRTLP